MMRSTHSLIKYNTTKSLISIILIILISFGFVGCSSKEVENLNDQIQELQSDYDQLLEEHSELEDEYQNIKKEHDELYKEIENYEDQQATIDDLNAKLTELQSQYDSLQADRDNLQQQVDAKKAAEEQAAQETQQQSLTQQASAGTVYWTPNGECYHSTSSCSTLKRSSNISSGTVEQSGRRPCKVCH